ncbi:MAG: phosphate/phosphite/phosphonate ABC transporter substrate-binding protein, partial [Gammaproteobacteria bacterium]|nr:phosphate/phosphite/phosphonate ABC transporter substrate-binding protein [Gammaproteobacteria bacterium]
TPDTYQDLVELFEQDKVDLAIFGGYLFLKVKESRGAKPLVLRNVDEKFRSMVVVNTRHDVTNFGGARGLSFAFGPKLSTAGHLMPRFYFKNNGINPENFFQNIIYSGSHSRTVKLVEEGRVDAGVANAITVKRMLTTGEVDKTKLRIIWESPPYTDYVWAVQKTMSDKKMNRIRDSFLSLDPGIARHETILSTLGAGYFMPAGQGAFAELSRVAISLGLLE